VIRSFKSKQTESLFLGRRVRSFESFAGQAERRLQILEDATSLQDLRGLPSNRLEGLKGDRSGQYSIRINDQWRVCFRWGDEGPFDVEIVDYHT